MTIFGILFISITIVVVGVTLPYKIILYIKSHTIVFFYFGFKRSLDINDFVEIEETDIIRPASMTRYYLIFKDLQGNGRKSICLNRSYKNIDKLFKMLYSMSKKAKD